MQGSPWDLPGLRGLSPIRRGVVTGLGLVAALAAIFSVTLVPYAGSPSSSFFGDVAQVAATLFIAYVVEISRLVRTLVRRDHDSANWVGGIGGIGISGAVGAGIALAISMDPEPTGVWVDLGLAFAAASVLLLGALVATMPFLLYDWNRTAHLNPDE